MNAIAKYDLKRAPVWTELEALSPNAQIETVEANPEGVFQAGDNFEATATVYVRLPEIASSNADSFPAHVVGKLGRNNKIQITTFNVDTSSFFDGPQISWQLGRF